MNKVEAVHLERKEHWRKLINECDASGLTQQAWCIAHGVCQGSLSKWRRQIWREEEAEEEFAAAREERSFVQITDKVKEEDKEMKELAHTREEAKAVSREQVQPIQPIQPVHQEEELHLVKPDAIIGFRDYMVGVYEHTSAQLLQKVMEVLRYA